MGRWVRRTSTDPLIDLPVARRENEDQSGHQCELPQAIDAGPRSVWECECGQRWRIAVPHWRPLPRTLPTQAPLDLPAWVMSLAEQQGPSSQAG